MLSEIWTTWSFITVNYSKAYFMEMNDSFIVDTTVKDPCKGEILQLFSKKKIHQRLRHIGAALVNAPSLFTFLPQTLIWS